MGKKLANSLQILKTIKAGAKASEVFTLEFVNALIDAIHALAAGENIKRGLNILPKSGPGYVILNCSAGSGGNTRELKQFALSVSGEKIAITDGTINGKYGTDMNGDGKYVTDVDDGEHKIWLTATVAFDETKPETQTPAAFFANTWFLPADIAETDAGLNFYIDYGPVSGDDTDDNDDGIPDDDPEHGIFHLELGSYTKTDGQVTVTQTRYGPFETLVVPLEEFIENGIVREGRSLFLATPAT